MTAARVSAQGVIPPQAGSELALDTIRSDRNLDLVRAAAPLSDDQIHRD